MQAKVYPVTLIRHLRKLYQEIPDLEQVQKFMEEEVGIFIPFAFLRIFVGENLDPSYSLGKQ